VARLLEVPRAIGRLLDPPAGLRFCVRGAAVFYDEAWLGDDELRGPADGIGFAALGYLAGLGLFARGAPPFPTRLDPDRAGARAAGCALSLAGVGAAERRGLGARLEAATGPRASLERWLAAFEAGAAACRR